MLAAGFPSIHPGQLKPVLPGLVQRRLNIHIFLHFLLPALLVLGCYRRRWLISYLLLMSGMLIDADHLLATPVYDPLRCSMGFHPLHTWPAALLYLLMLIPRPLRLPAIGLLIHLLLDSADCLIMPGGAEKLSQFFDLSLWTQ